MNGSGTARTIAGALLAIWLGAHPALAADEVFFVCADGREFSAEFAGETVTLLFGGEMIDLPRVPSGSGAKFEDNVFVFWNDGDEALYEVKGQFQTTCVVDDN